MGVFDVMEMDKKELDAMSATLGADVHEDDAGEGVDGSAGHDTAVEAAEDSGAEDQDAPGPDETGDGRQDAGAAQETQDAGFEKARKGLEAAVASERQKRQEAERLAAQLEGKLSGFLEMLERRKAGFGDSADAPVYEPEKGGAPQKPAEKPRIKVEFDEDGNAFVDPAHFMPLIEQRTLPVERVIEETRRRAEEARQEEERQALLNSVLAEHEGGKAAYEKLLSGYKALDDLVSREADKAGIQRGPEGLSPRDALVLLDRTGAAREWAKIFPDADIVTVATMHESVPHLRQALSRVIGQSGQSAAAPARPGKKAGPSMEDVERAEKAGNRPAGIGSVASARSAGQDILSRMEKISVHDIMNLPSSEIKKLEELARGKG